MNDQDTHAPGNWREAFAALPLETPPPDAFAVFAAQVQRAASLSPKRQPRRWPWLALAAAVLLVVAMPMVLREMADPVSVPVAGLATAPNAASPDEITQALVVLQTRSAQLEDLLMQMRDERVASGPAAALDEALEERLVLIDTALFQPSLPEARLLVLWRERVAALQQLAAFQGSQRLLAAQGERYDGRLVAFD